MNRGLIEKSVREVWLITLCFGAGLLVVEALLGYVFPTFQSELSSVLLGMKFVQRLLEALLGTEFAGALGPHVFTAFPWVHPAVLIIVAAYEVTLSSRLPAGEIDRGTADVLLGLPVSRWQVYVSDAVVWMAGGGVLLGFALAGNAAGTALARDAALPEAARLSAVLANLYCLYLATGGVTYLLSALSSHRGRAVGASLAVLLASFVINFLALLWEPAESLAPLSFLTYYRPIEVLDDGHWPLMDMAILSAVAAGSWGVGGLVFARRDVRTT